jgi:hypothetical protein
LIALAVWGQNVRAADRAWSAGQNESAAPATQVSEHEPQIGATGPEESATAEAPKPLVYDQAKYMSPDELKRGMKGFGRTVMTGTEIETFQFEVLSVMKNAFEPQQDVILVRCSGLGLEQSGIIAGMSGSPCYIRDDAGRERMIGAVAFGWPLSKAPICGVQPITQMLDIPEVRGPQRRPKPPASAPEPGGAAGGQTRGYSLGALIGRAQSESIEAGSRFSVFNEDVRRLRTPAPPATRTDAGLSPLALPVMVSGASSRALAWIQGRFDRLGMKLVASGAASPGDKAEAGEAGFQPGSVLCIPLLSGDMNMEALGTCTEVVGNKVLGFGHNLFARGSTELPLATGTVHTVFPSMHTSFKIGASLKTVGTLWGDEQTGIFGTCGPIPATAPLEVGVRDVRGQQRFRYQMARDRVVGAFLLDAGVGSSIFSHNELPDDHVVKYRIQVEFEGAGTFEAANFTSMVGMAGLAEDLLIPTLVMFYSPFGEAKIAKAKVDVEIEPVARSAHIDRMQLPRLVYKPGETVPVRIRWRHERREPEYSEATYSIVIPPDLRDGEYALTATSAQGQIMALRKEKPHLWRVDNLGEALAALNLAASFPDNRLYLRLALPQGGLAVGRNELPELPSYRQQIMLDARRGDVGPYTEALVAQTGTDFVVNGSQSVTIKVSRKTEY